MEFDINTWTSIAALAVSVLGLFPRNKEQRDEKQQRALLAVSNAYHETAAYLEFQEANGRDRVREWSIAEKWEEAALLLKKYDSKLPKHLRKLSGDLRKLPERLQSKAEYWRLGVLLGPEAIQAAGIGLTTIWREVRNLLGTEADPPADDGEQSEVELLRFICSYCGKRCKAPTDAVGRKGRCPRCGISLVVPAPGLLEERWYYAKNPKRLRIGPISTSELRQAIQNGSFSSDDMVWKEGTVQWVPIRDLKWD